ncbi:MAG: hypothetical protein AB7O24_23310 [Kofleriaceae bacterium]
MRRPALLAMLAIAMVGELQAQPAQPVDPAVAIPVAGVPASDPGPSAPVIAIKDPKEAKRWLGAAQQLVHKADALARNNHSDEARIHYENAVTAYRNAIDAGDDPSLLFQIAGVFEKLGQLDDAYRSYRELSKITAGVRGDIQTKTAAKLGELAGELGLVTLVIAQADAAITLGDKPLGRAPLTEPLVMMPGRYQLWLAAGGFVPKAVELNIEAGSEIERTIALDPVVVTPNLPPPPASGMAAASTGTARVQPEPLSKMPLYVGGGVALVAAGVSFATGLAAMSAHDTYVDPGSTRHQRENAQVRGRNLALASDLSMATALVAGAMTVYWYVASYRPVTRARRSKVEVAPWVQPTMGGVALVGEL